MKVILFFYYYLLTIKIGILYMFAFLNTKLGRAVLPEGPQQPGGIGNLRESHEVLQADLQSSVPGDK